MKFLGQLNEEEIAEAQPQQDRSQAIMRELSLLFRDLIISKELWPPRLL
jgi:hypothetical protein